MSTERGRNGRLLLGSLIVLAFVGGSVYEQRQTPEPQVDSGITILHYEDCYDVRSPEGWPHHISIAGGDYVDFTQHTLDDILASLCPEDT